MIIVKIYLGISLELLRAVQGQFSFRQFLVPAYTFQYLQPLSNVVGVNYRDFNLLHLSLPKWFPLFIWQVSSVSNFCPDTRGRWWSLFQAHLFSCAVGREEHCKQISLACVLSQATLLMLQVALLGNFYDGPWVACTSHIYATQVQVLRYSTKAQTGLGLHSVPFPCPSSSDDQVLGKHSHTQVGGASYPLPHPSHSVFWVHSHVSGVPCVSSGELISGCDPPDGCQLSRIPGRLGLQLGACMQFGRGCSLLG